MFQSYALFPHMTVAENVGFGLEMQGIAAAERLRRVGETLELVGLGAFAARYPRQLSGGQQQRVALARALVIRPQILLLDEPLSNLDAKLREEMQIELRQIQRTVGTTTILVTHDQAEAMALSDRLVVMNKGRAEQIGPPHEAYERPATPFVASFLGRTNLLGGASVRPEKIFFATASSATSLAGTVRTRIFQGNHWLYQVEDAGRPRDRDPPEHRRDDAGRGRRRAFGVGDDMSARITILEQHTTSCPSPPLGGEVGRGGYTQPSKPPLLASPPSGGEEHEQRRRARVRAS